MSLQRRVASLERTRPPSESLDPAIETFLEGLETAELRAVLECARGRALSPEQMALVNSVEARWQERP